VRYQDYISHSIDKNNPHTITIWKFTRGYN